MCIVFILFHLFMVSCNFSILESGTGSSLCSGVGSSHLPHDICLTLDEDSYLFKFQSLGSDVVSSCE